MDKVIRTDAILFIKTYRAFNSGMQAYLTGMIDNEKLADHWSKLTKRGRLIK